MNGNAIEFGRAAGLLVLLLGLAFAISETAEIPDLLLGFWGDDLRVTVFIAVLLTWVPRGVMLLLIAEIARRMIYLR